MVCRGRIGGGAEGWTMYQDEMDEEDRLIAQAQSGNDQALNELIKKYEGWIKSRVRSWIKTNPQFDAEQIESLGWQAIWESIKAIDIPRGSVLRKYAEKAFKWKVLGLIKYNKAKKRTADSFGENGSPDLMADCIVDRLPLQENKPCISCGTTGGAPVRPGERPCRTRGRCKKCAGHHRYVENRENAIKYQKQYRKRKQKNTERLCTKEKIMFAIDKELPTMIGKIHAILERHGIFDGKEDHDIYRLIFFYIKEYERYYRDTNYFRWELGSEIEKEIARIEEVRDMIYEGKDGTGRRTE
jgi:hypothetical protein